MSISFTSISASAALLSEKTIWKEDLSINLSSEKPFCRLFKEYSDGVTLSMLMDKSNNYRYEVRKNSFVFPEGFSVLLNNQDVSKDKKLNSDRSGFYLDVRGDIFLASEMNFWSIQLQPDGVDFYDYNVKSAEQLLNICMRRKNNLVQSNIVEDVKHTKAVEVAPVKSVPVLGIDKQELPMAQNIQALPEEKNDVTGQKLNSRILSKAASSPLTRDVDNISSNIVNSQIQQNIGQQIPISITESQANIRPEVPASEIIEKNQQLERQNKELLDKLAKHVDADNIMRNVVANTSNSSQELGTDERDLLESMKTKMFLLEREKEAIRQKLIDQKQKEIAVLKIDVGAVQKLRDQDAKIKLLEEQLKNKNYQAFINDQDISQSEDSNLTEAVPNSPNPEILPENISQEDLGAPILDEGKSVPEQNISMKEEAENAVRELNKIEEKPSNAKDTKETFIENIRPLDEISQDSVNMNLEDSKSEKTIKKPQSLSTMNAGDIQKIIDQSLAQEKN